MKKMNNKGFSLVELIIVIAIMAILAGAIAPALIRYIDKSRKSNDISSAKTVKTAVETALGNEDIYTDVLNNHSAGSLYQCWSNTGLDSTAIEEIQSNIGNSEPKPKYKKQGQSDFYWSAETSGQVTVFVGTSSPTGSLWELAPEQNASYK